MPARLLYPEKLSVTVDGQRKSKLKQYLFTNTDTQEVLEEKPQSK